MNFASFKDWFGQPEAVMPPHWRGRAGSWYTQQVTAQTLGVMAWMEESRVHTDLDTRCPYRSDDPLCEHWVRGYEQAGGAFE